VKSLDYVKLKQEVIDALEKSRSIVLATCSNNRVTAREVYYASDLLCRFTAYTMRVLMPEMSC